MKRKVLQTDWNVCITEANNHSSTAIAARIATNASWLKLWDMALDHGPHGTNCLQALYRELTRPQFQKGVCVFSVIPYSIPPIFIIIFSHTRLSNPELLISSLSSADLDIFMCGNFKVILILYYVPLIIIAGLHCIKYYYYYYAHTFVVARDKARSGRDVSKVLFRARPLHLCRVSHHQRATYVYVNSAPHQHGNAWCALWCDGYRMG